MNNAAIKKILIEPANEEELKIIQAFIQERKLKAFMVQDNKANENDVFNDVVRLLIPIMR